MTRIKPISSQLYNEAIALAGVFQAAALVDQVATQGRCDEENFAASVDSVLKLDAPTLEAIYGGQVNFLPGLSLGFAELEHVLQEKRTINPDTLRYVMGLLHLQKKLQREEELINVVRTRLAVLNEQMPHFEDSREMLNERLAGIYEDTLSTFRYRIQVNGNRLYLENPANVCRIRALLFAGIRSVMLWRQTGGKRWHLFLYRQKMLDTVRELK